LGTKFCPQNNIISVRLRQTSSKIQRLIQTITR